MYRIRFNAKKFDDPHWVTQIKRWKFSDDKSIREYNISSFVYWKCKKLKTAESMLADLMLYSEKSYLFEIEEFEE